MALILLVQGCLFGGKAWRDRSMPIGAAAARAQGCCRCRTMEAAAADAAGDLRSDFLQVLRSRRRNPDGMHLVMEACPKENVENFKEGLIEENIYLTTEAYASRGYVAIAIDSRYHGERANSTTAYKDVWDLIKLADYLMQRKDIDPSRIGITGESLGG
ncbi:hypothetical protein GW17_00039489 [Ensete ventricosum]|nr:hypothetical protein GW17_00039489 [Ensete ventricosum]